ncbi:MAG: hypothetical protein CMI63_17990 [Parvularcula sp.]|nr:hypothetical protein [Parvularcula sp.]
MSRDKSTSGRLTIGVSPMVKKVMEGFKISRAVRSGDWLFTNGQMDIGDNAKTLNPDDMLAQSVTCMRSIYEVVARADCRLAELAQIQVFYLADAIENETAYREQILEEFPECRDTLMILTPVPSFATVGHVVEIDAIAVKGKRRAVKSEKGVTLGVRRGDWVFAEARSNNSPADALAELRETLDGLGADVSDACRIYAYYGAEREIEERVSMQLELATAFQQSRPAIHATLLPGNRSSDCKIALEIIANVNADAPRRGFGSAYSPDAIEDWPFSNALRCGEVVFVSGQFPVNETGEIVHRGDIAEQARAAMRALREALAEAGAGMGDLAKIKTYYEGAWDKENWFDNLRARMELLSDPGPASSGIEGLPPVEDDALLSVDGVAVLEQN